MSDDKKNIGRKNMKKFFKTPEELKAKGFQEYETFLNNYIKKRKDDAPAHLHRVALAARE